ncbi:21612_t:CDS:2, partial [Gigaspora rosea]
NFKNWTSGNQKLDQLIQEYQLINTINPTHMIEWIPFDHIDWVVHKAKGGFGSVYTARWIDGPIIDWDDFGQKFIRDGSTIIILKSLDNSSNINENLIKEALAHLNVAKKKTQLTGVNMLYGITKHPYTGNYMLLLEKAECDLREYLQNNDNRLTWKKRYRLLNEISQALDIIHTNGMVHRDFHPGNILLKANNQWTFWWQVTSRTSPFNNYRYDFHLTKAICDGKRPPIVPGTPDDYIKLMERCWNKEPSSRPDTSELRNFFDKKLKLIYEGQYEDILELENIY